MALAGPPVSCGALSGLEGHAVGASLRREHGREQRNGVVVLSELRDPEGGGVPVLPVVPVRLRRARCHASVSTRHACAGDGRPDDLADDLRRPRRSLGPLIAVIGFVLLGVVAGLAFTMAQGAGTPAGTMSALTSPAVPPTASPTASPTPDLRETAASEFRAFEDAYLDAYNALHDTLPATGQFASYSQARSYYGTEVQNLRRFEASLRGMTFPTDVDPDAQTLLERISNAGNPHGQARRDQEGSRRVGDQQEDPEGPGRDACGPGRRRNGLGLGYAATPKPTTPKPTPKPIPTAKPNPVARYDPAAAERYMSPTPNTPTAFRHAGEPEHRRPSRVLHGRWGSRRVPLPGQGGSFRMAAGYIDGLVR